MKIQPIKHNVLIKIKSEIRIVLLLQENHKIISKNKKIPNAIKYFIVYYSHKSS